MIYLLTVVNAIILGIVAYLFYTFRKAVETSGVKQVDDYLHELEGSVAQLTEQFERSSTKISKELLRKTTELQALIGECDTKVAEINRLRSISSVTAADVLAGRPARASVATPQPSVPADVVKTEEPVSGVATVPAAVAARRLSASEALAGRASTRERKRAEQARTAAAAQPESAPVAVTELPADGAPAEAGSAEAAQPLASAVGQPNEKYRLIFLLASEGMDTASIAKHTNLTRSEVEMLLDLRRQGKI
ncbi:MAG TPA: hypothetical protein VK009_28275 [Chloroflexota bacterium]|nr:hypothetical protein [Chloroflexota bacterium]